jgi:hypothetical protein
MDFLKFKNELQHHGVKGQKWGVRKQDEITTVPQRKYLGPDKNKESVKKSVAIGGGAALGAIGAGVLSAILFKKTKEATGGYISQEALSAFKRNTALRAVGFAAIGATVGYSLNKLRKKYGTPDRAHKKEIEEQMNKDQIK